MIVAGPLGNTAEEVGVRPAILTLVLELASTLVGNMVSVSGSVRESKVMSV
jgi:hypothetical protein